MSRIEITCGQGALSYTAVLQADDIAVFKEVAGRYALRNKEGEALVSAIVTAAFGKVRSVERYNQAGQLRDSPEGMAAREIYGDFAKLLEVERCKDGGSVRKLFSAEVARYLSEKCIYQTSNGEARALPKKIRFLDDIEITCGKGETAYQVILSADDIGFFEKVLSSDEAKNKTGEALILEFIAQSEGHLKNIRRLKNGVYNDAPTGEPACHDFYEGGKVVHIHYCKDGSWHSPSELIPAVQHFTDGKLDLAAHYDRGTQTAPLSEKDIADYLEKKSIVEKMGGKIRFTTPKL
jgi:hypothetical protein